MSQVAVLVLTALVTGALLRANARVAFVILVVAAALVPPGLKVPNDISSQLLVFRFVLVAFALGTILRRRAGAGGPRLFAATPVDGLIVVYLAVVLVAGILLASPSTSLAQPWERVLVVADQFGLFLAVVAGLREVDDLRWCVNVIVVAFSLTAGLALLERATGQRLVTTLVGHLVPPEVGTTLVKRGGQFRPTASYEFPQELGLVLACLVPLGLAAGASARRAWLWFSLTMLIGAAALLTISRSAAVALAVGAAVYLVASRRAVSRWLVVAGVVAVAAGSLLVPSVRRAYHAPDTVSSSTIRRQHLPVIGALVAHRPWTGAGLAALKDETTSTDNQYELTYAELGVIGLCAGGALWLGVAFAVAFGLRGRTVEREVSAACLAGLAAALVTAASIDLFALGAARVFWLLAAVGCYAAERAGPWPAVRRLLAPVRYVGAAAVVLVAAGLGVAVAAPRHQVTELVFETWPVGETAASQRSGFDENRTATATVCQAASHVANGRPGAGVLCAAPADSAGAGTLRVSEPARSGASTVVPAVVGALSRLPGFRVHVESRVARALGNPARTSPLWLAAAGLFLLLWPRLAPRAQSP